MKKKIFSLGIIIALAGFIILSCTKNAGTTNNANNNNPTTVSIVNMAFGNPSLTVTSGTTVTWTNNDNTSHTVTADDNTFNSGILSPGSSFTHQFNTAGVFHYHCNIHSMMMAIVTVN